MSLSGALPSRNDSLQEIQAIEDQELARTISRIIDDKQGEDIRILDVSGPLAITDYFVIASARNTRHARAIASEVVFTMKQEGRLCRGAAGNEGESGWVLLDFNGVVVHIFLTDTRSFYDLEGLWADVPRLEFTPAPKRDEPLDDLDGLRESFPAPIVPDSGSTL